MLYLVDELYKYKNKTITITFGKPIDYKIFGKQRTAQGWAAALRDYIYLLKNNPNQPFVAD